MQVIDRRTALLWGACLCAPKTWAQSTRWPQHSLKIVVPYPPGGQSDLVSRFISAAIAPWLGQPCIVENRPGAQGIVGTAAVAAMAADGHTVLYGNISTMAINPHVYAKLPYRPLTDFVPVVQLGANALCLVVRADSPIQTLAQFLTAVRASGGKMAYASNGLGSAGHLYGEMLKQGAALDLLHVPYQGGAPATLAVLSGQVQAGISDFGIYGPHLKAGKLRGLAVTGPTRWRLFDDIPTFSELGFPLDMAGWNGLFMHARTAAADVSALHAMVNRVIATPEGRTQMMAMGLDATALSQTAFAEIVRNDTDRWGQVIRKAGLRLEQ